MEKMNEQVDSERCGLFTKLYNIFRFKIVYCSYFVYQLKFHKLFECMPIAIFLHKFGNIYSKYLLRAHHMPTLGRL